MNNAKGTVPFETNYYSKITTNHTPAYPRRMASGRGITRANNTTKDTISSNAITSILKLKALILSRINNLRPIIEKKCEKDEKPDIRDPAG